MNPFRESILILFQVLCQNSGCLVEKERIIIWKAWPPVMEGLLVICTADDLVAILIMSFSLFLFRFLAKICCNIWAAVHCSDQYAPNA